jgi:DNA repair exonuclease SbcCD ATPase subunit
MAETLPLSQRLEQRLKALRQELETGQKMLADLEAQRRGLKQTILRIAGAIQVLEELLADTKASGPDPASAVNHVVEGAAVKAPDRADRSVDQATGVDQPRAERSLGTGGRDLVS